MKKCSKCKIEKEFSRFYKNRARYDGYCNYCKECDKKKSVNKEKARANYKKWRNSEKGSQYFQEYYQKNREDYAERNKKWCEANPERMRELWRNYTKSEDWRKKHKANQARRRARKHNATIEGYDKEISKIYKNCPEGHHVDHIVPLRGKTVCGLHVPWNLQYLPAEENIRKNNNFDGGFDV